MESQPTFNILMYSHDTYGLGHIRRTMAIASQLKAPDVNIIIITGSPIAGRFDFPEQIDFVRVPGMIKKSDDLYVPHSVKLNPTHALEIRQNIIKATAKTFKPNLLIVDKAPLGLKKEILPTLKMLKKATWPCRTILGLRDIMDDADSTIRDWKKKRIYDVLDKYYSEIWVYGSKELYDPICEYRIPESISRKMLFTGYIPRPRLNGRQTRREQNVDCKQKLVVVTTGGGGDGYPLLDSYVSMIERMSPHPNFRTIMVSGPFMPKAEREDIAARAKSLPIKFYHFNRQMDKLIAAADLVVSMGGYNTLCEILTHKRASLIVPRETPRLEQRIRAEVMQKQQLVDFIPWNDLSPQTLSKKLTTLLNDITPCKSAIQGFLLTGLDVIRKRITQIKSEVL